MCQRRQPTPRKTKDHFTLDRARRVSQLARMMHDKGIRARVVSHRIYIRQLCQSRCDIACSTPLAHHARDFDHGGFAVVTLHMRLRINPEVI